MPQIVYRKNSASPWIKQGDRLTKTFASGLCLIQQTYVAPKALATYNAFVEGEAITDSQPCIDGAYIYPAPDYQDTGDGFMRCTVTAYGRWKTEAKFQSQMIEGDIFVFYGQEQNANADYPGLYETKTLQFVRAASEATPDDFGSLAFSAFFKKSGPLTYSTDFGTKFILPITQALTLFTPIPYQENGVKKLRLSWTQNITRFDIANYGAWNEYTVTIQPSVLAFVHY